MQQALPPLAACCLLPVAVVMHGTAVVVAFWVLSALTLGSALMIAFVRDLIHAVLFLVLSFMGVAGLYITLSADFVAVVQVLIYVGAISVLMLFATLLTPRSDRDNGPVSFSAPVAVAAGLDAAVIRFSPLSTHTPTPTLNPSTPPPPTP